MLETPRYNLSMLVKKIGRESAPASTGEAQASSLLPFIREFQLGNARRRLLFRCQIFSYLGMTLFLSSLLGGILGYSVLALGLGFLGLGLSLFSRVWKRYLPDRQQTEGHNLHCKKSNLTKEYRGSDPPVKLAMQCPAFNHASSIPAVTAVEAEAFFSFTPKCSV
jgi:hypothetical protein